jgi:hypothetical protein
VASLTDFVTVNVTANSTTVQRQGFGIPLILTYHTRFVEKYRSYTSLAGMTADGFTSYDAAYRRAAAMFSQNPAPASVVVGRLPSAPAFTQVLTMTSATEGQHVRFKVIEPATGTVQSIDYTIPSSATTTTVATAVELLVEAVTGVDSAASTANITVTPTVAGRRVEIYDLENCTLEETTAAAGYDTELTALKIVNNTWFFISTDSSSAANVAAVGAWALANKKMYFAALHNSSELSGTGTIGSDLKALSNNFTALLWAPNAHQSAASAWIGVGAPQQPGDVNWAGMLLRGEQQNLETDNINHYQTVAGVARTRLGKVASGEWIDVVHGTEALKADLAETVYLLLVGAGTGQKVPFTKKGFDLMQAHIEAAGRRFESSNGQPGLLQEGSFTVVMPNPDSFTSEQKNSRILTGVRFSALYEQAVNSVGMDGTISS